ncbi:MAG: hypothetical protein IJX30_03135 [Clostridia bacterium]|nr:hypothetical protein [Clostridia bacterium]
MINFQHYFKEEYQFTLKSIDYTLIEKTADDLQLNVSDTVSLEQIERQFQVDFCRRLCFKPEALYDLKVVFQITLTLKDDMNVDALDKESLNKEFLNPENPYLNNVVGRASALIAQITAAYGLTPIITPPNLII